MAQNPVYDLKNNVGGGVSLKPGTSLSGLSASNGDWIDCATLEGPVHGEFGVGSATGSPTSFSIACKLQEASDSSGTGSQDLATQTTLALTADKTRGMVRGIRTMQYVRCVATPTFSGGSSPTQSVVGHVMGQKQRY